MIRVPHCDTLEALRSFRDKTLRPLSVVKVWKRSQEREPFLYGLVEASHLGLAISYFTSETEDVWYELYSKRTLTLLYFETTTDGIRCPHMVYLENEDDVEKVLKGVVRFINAYKQVFVLDEGDYMSHILYEAIIANSVQK